MQNDIAQQLEQIKDAWDAITVVPEDLTGWGFPGLTKQSIGDAVGGIAETAKHLSSLDNFEPQAVSKAFVQQNITQLRAYVTQHIPSNPQPHIPGMLQYLEWIRASLRQWLDETDKKSRNFSSSLSDRLAESLSRMRDAEKLFEVIQSSHDLATKFAKKAESDVSEIAQLNTEALKNSETISTALKTSNSLLATNQEHTQKITSLLSDLTTLKGELETNKATQATIFAEFESRRKQINDLLEDSNRAGMAAAFVTRKNDLILPLRIWGGVFAVSLIGLAYVAIWQVLPGISEAKWEELLLRLPMTAPLVWLGWFSAKQYGYTVRLREDYAYKVASAMAFEGYKREAAKVNEDLLEKLMDTSISNFGDNPLRIFDGSGNHASPLHEILERSLKDEKFTDLLKAVIAKIKG